LIARIEKVVEAAHFARYAPDGLSSQNFDAAITEIQAIL